MLTFYFDSDLDLDPDAYFKHVEKSDFLLTFIDNSTSLHCFTFIVIVTGVKFSKVWTVMYRYIEIFRKKA